MNKYRSHNCSEIGEKDIDKIVTLSGWLHRKRDHGNLLFVDLRDHYGITQCVIENDNELFPIIENKTRVCTSNFRKSFKERRWNRKLRVENGKSRNKNSSARNFI